MKPETLLRAAFEAAIEAARAENCVPGWLPSPPRGRTLVVGAGKAAAAMALAFDRHWQAELTGALQAGANQLEIEVTNPWANRLIGDASLPPEQRRPRTYRRKPLG